VGGRGGWETGNGVLEMVLRATYPPNTLGSLRQATLPLSSGWRGHSQWVQLVGTIRGYS
jgi:hypothetical protein